MIISVLLAALALAALTQPTAPRLFAALIFVGVTLSHEFILSDLDGFAYYGSAALFDLCIIAATSGINPIPRMVITLHKICLISMGANLFGWILWFSYFPPDAYNALFSAIYLWALITLIIRGRVDVGGFTSDSWATCFRFADYTRRGYFLKYKGEARS